MTGQLMFMLAGVCIWRYLPGGWTWTRLPMIITPLLTINKQLCSGWAGRGGAAAEGETTKKSVLTSEYLGTAGSITTETLPPISQSNDKHCLLNNGVMRL